MVLHDNRRRFDRYVGEDRVAARRTLKRYVASGDLPSYRVGRRVLVRRADFEAWMEKRGRWAAPTEDAAHIAAVRKILYG